MSSLPDLTVLMGGAVAARLRSSPDGTLSLVYDGGYLDTAGAVPLSLSLPFSDRPHPHRAVERWVRSLLPDNPNVLSRWYRREAVPQRTPFGLLSTSIGLDCAGAVQFCPAGAEHRLAQRASGIQTLSAAQVRREIAAIVSEPDVWHSAELEPYFSLGGHQSKIALHRSGDRWGRPYGSVPTTHILKPRPHAARLVAVAEHLCLDAARRLGLSAAASRIEHHGTATALVVERYDRAFDGGHWTRIHQEDMCQALGIDGERKYEHSGGPGMSHIGDLIRRHSTSPDDDLRRFADALVYSWLIVNRDAHARNYSLVHTPSTVRLAPLYDINSSLMFPRPKLGEANMAMRYGSTFTVYAASAERALPDTAARLRLPAAELADRAGHLASELPAAMEAAARETPADAGAEPEIERFLAAVKRRSAHCLNTAAAAHRHIR